jgi:branched-chain amino acid transport system substrate-binding protein
MQRRKLLGAASLLAVLATLGLAPVIAQQEPMVFGLITPLSPPGETALGQLAKRGAEIGVEYINEKGGVLGRKVALSVHDSAGKNEQGVAAYRRLVSSE